MVKKIKKEETINNEEVKTEELKNKDFRIKNFKEEIDKYIKERVDEETKKGINIKDYKDQIDKYARERVEVETSSQTVKNIKKQLHSSRVSSCIKSIIILCLLACIGYGIYYLYSDGYFDENKGVKCTENSSNSGSSSTDTKDKTDEPDKKVEPVDEKQELINKYSYLLENITFDVNSNYTRDYYNGNLTNELKEYLAYKLIDSENIINDEDSSYFELSDMETAYNVLFNEKLEPTTFKYNNATYKYLVSKEMFVSSIKANEEKKITKEITDVTVNDKEVIITTVEGYVADNGRLYNILTNKRISSYKTTDTLEKHKNKLNTIQYIFVDEHLDRIEK